MNQRLGAALLLLAGGAPAHGDPGPPVPPPAAVAGAEMAPGPPVELPRMTVNRARLADFPPIAKRDLAGGGLAPTEPPVRLMYPGSAYSAGIQKGYALVCVELDEQGNATDFLLAGYSEKYFGEALLRNAKDTKYRPLLFKGVAIPSRFAFGYEFRPEFSVAMNSFEAIDNRQLTVRGGRPDLKYRPVLEEELDTRLEYVRHAVPCYPAGFTPSGGKGDWVMVTLYVDEDGHVRVPQVESASSPLLVANALKAAHYWQFKPPMVKGRPALVYAAFAMTFVPAPK